MARSQLLEKSQAFAEDALEKTKSIYSSVSDQLPEGSGPIIGIVSAGLLLGAVGFAIGRSSIKNEESLADNKTDLSPVFKFLKLWMLYRAAI